MGKELRGTWRAATLVVFVAVVAACATSPGERSATTAVPGPIDSVPAAGGRTESVKVETANDTANPFRTGRTLVIPHAGGDGLFPENTLFAYEQSQALGGDVIDADVKMAADGVLVAFHDSTLDRTTDGSGPVADLTSSELAQLDAGFDFDVDGAFPFRGTGIGVPTIEDILLAFPDTLTTLDLKVPGAPLVQPMCDLLRRLGRTDDVYIGTESDDQPDLFRAACPEVHTSGTSEERQVRRAAQEAGATSSPIAQLVSQPSYIGNDGQPRITEEFLAFAQASDTAVLTWVIDDPDTLATLIEMGIDGVYTRRPDVMVEVRDAIEQRAD